MELYKDYISSFSVQADSTVQKYDFWHIFEAKNSSPTAEDISITPPVRLHSSYNPEREAYNAVTNQNMLEKQTAVFYGCGLGYHLIQLADFLETNKIDKKIILIEPKPEYFFAALSVLDWAPVFRIEKLVLAIGCPAESLMPLLESSDHINIGGEGVSNSYFFEVPAFTAHAQDYFNTVKTLIYRNKTKNDINAATYKKFSKLWIRNSKKNLDKIQSCSTVNNFLAEITETETATRTTAPARTDCLIVAAGPSLQNILPYLSELKKRLIIICVETALHSMLRQNIQPDFIIITDPQYYAYRHLAGLSAPQSTLICPLSVYPAVFRFKCHQILLCSDFFPISTFFEQQLGAFGNLGAGGSVASSAWNLAYMLKAKNIYFAGLDLSFPSKQTHIKGSSAEQTFHTRSTRLTPAEKAGCGSMFGANPEYGVSYSGQKVLTDSRMKMFAWWFESRIAACPEVKTYSLCSESLMIPGVEFFDVKTLLEKCVPREPVDDKKESLEPVLAVSSHETAGADNRSFQNKNKIAVCTTGTDRSNSTQGKNETVCTSTPLYLKHLKTLTSLVNTAVEKCIIGGDSLEAELKDIERQLSQNPLSEIIRLAYPSEKELEEIPAKQKKLYIYQKLQKELKLYNS